MINPIDKLLEEQGLKYEDLNMVERETYKAANFDLSSISSGDLKQHIVDMKNSIALQLCDIDPQENYYVDLQLKSRLKNYILLESFLATPEKAEKAIKDSLKNMKGTI